MMLMRVLVCTFRCELVSSSLGRTPRRGAAGSCASFLFNFLKNRHLTLFWLPPQAQKISDDLMQKISTQNRRALDLVAAKCYYYHARVYEFLDKLDVVRRYRWPRVWLVALGSETWSVTAAGLWACRGQGAGRCQVPVRK